MLINVCLLEPLSTYIKIIDIKGELRLPLFRITSQMMTKPGCPLHQSSSFLWVIVILLRNKHTIKKKMHFILSYPWHISAHLSTFQSNYEYYLLFASFLDIFCIFLEFIWSLGFSILFVSITLPPTPLISSSSSGGINTASQTHKRGGTSWACWGITLIARWFSKEWKD